MIGGGNVFDGVARHDWSTVTHVWHIYALALRWLRSRVTGVAERRARGLGGAGNGDDAYSLL